MFRILGTIVFLGLVALGGAAANSYYRLEHGETFVDREMRKLTGKEDSLDRAKKQVDKFFEKAREVIDSTTSGSGAGGSSSGN